MSLVIALELSPLIGAFLDASQKRRPNQKTIQKAISSLDTSSEELVDTTTDDLDIKDEVEDEGYAYAGPAG